MVKLAKAGKNQDDSKKMALPPKEVEEDSEDEEMSDEKDESSGEEVIIPQKKGKKATTPGKKVMVSPTKKIAVAIPGKNAVVTPGKKAAVTSAKALATPDKKGAATPVKGAKNSKMEDSDEEDDDEEDEDEDEFQPAVMKATAAAPASDNEDEDEEDDEEDDSEEEPMEVAPAKGKKAPVKAVPVKAKSTAEDEDEEDDEVVEEDDEEEEEEPVKETPGKGKKKMAKQKAAPEAKKQKVEATEPTTAFNLFVGNLNFNKSAPELKTGISDVFAKNDLAVVDVRIGVSRKFGYVDFESAEDLEKALELTGLKVFGNEIKLEKPKGKDSKKGALFDMATKKKQRKTEDENRVFKVEWTETFAFIQNLNGLPTCLICQEKLAHNKKSNLERHFTTKHVSFSTKYPVGDARKKAVEELQKKSQEKSSSVFNYWMPSSNNVDIASFVVSQEIAKRGKPYTDGEYIKSCFINASEELFRDFKNKADILKKIKELPLSAKTVKDGTVKMSSNITDQRVEDLKLVSALSIAVGESCDINDTAQISLFVRFISATGPKEELLGLLPLKGQTRGEDIANAVIECIEKHHIPLDKIVSISTDGAKSMTGVRNGFVGILKEKINHEILTYHCIIHQEALCAQTFPEEICKVMELVINIINSIITKALNHRQFKEFLVEIEREYADLLLHNKVRWLSRGNVLKRFASLLTEIKTFLLEKGVHYPELWNDQWIQKFYFMVDIMSHLNHLNRKLQGKGNTVFSMLEEVISFENKLSLFAQDFERETLIHFPSLLKHCQENNSYIDIWYFKTTLLNMREAFLNRFQDIRNSKATLAFVKKPLNATVTELNFSPFNIDIGNFEMQLLDLKNKELWSSKFERLCADIEILEKNKCELSSQHKWSALKDLEKEDMLIFNTWNSIPDSYNQLKKLAFAVLSLFGSTYLCEQLFLESCLKLKTTYKPDLPKLSKEMQGHCSH